MNNNKRPLVPFFLQKLDASLLRNQPVAWEARTHLVLFFAALFAVAISAFCFLVFFDAREYSSLSGWVTLTGLFALVGFVFWLIFLLRFNVFKRFGNWHAGDAIKSFVLYFISIAAIVAICFIPSAIQTYRANQQFGNEEIVNDINELNATVCKLEYDILPLAWTPDTCRVVDTIIAEEYADTDSAITVPVTARFHRIDTSELRKRLETADSAVKLNDTLYIFCDCPDYLFVNSYSADEYTKAKIYRSPQLFRNVIQRYQKPDRAALLKRMNELKTKWAVNDHYGYYADNTYLDTDPYTTKVSKKYELTRISNGIDNAARKKYEWRNSWQEYLRVFYYITLVLTLLVFIFRHSTVKTFFLSLLTAVILIIVTALMMLANYGDTETSVLSFIVVYYIIFGAAALSVLGASVRNALQGIALNIFVFMTPFMPLVFVALNEAMHYKRSYEPGYVEAPRNTALYFLIAEIAGAVLLLLLCELLFRKLYRKWFAAPEN